MITQSHIQPFRDALAADWKEAFQCDEWYFAKIISDITSHLSSDDAFTAIDELVELLHHQTDSAVIYYVGTFLISLARRSKTTELPKCLREEWEFVTWRMSEYTDVLDQLRAWYRLQ